jgi:DNA-binding Lrp family transcriptional regulator
LQSSVLEKLKAKFVGVNPKFVECISDGVRISERYAKLLDYVQYNNPPFNQHRIEDELGIPQPSVSRALKKLREEGETRVRQDIDLNRIALKTLFVFYEGILLPVIPAVDWVASGWWTNNGTLLVYRVPPEYERKLVDAISEKLGEPSEVIGVKSYFLAKPSIEYYFAREEVREEDWELNPVKAIEMLDKHPPVPKNVVGFTGSDMTLEFKDPRALELLAYLEYDVVEARNIYSKKYSLKLYNVMVNRISRILRGARVMFLDKENVVIFAKIESSRACSEHIAKTLAVYPYAVNILLTDEDGLIIVLSMPFKYWGSVMKWILSLCGQGTVGFEAHVTTLNGSLIRQYIPWRNYNNDKHYWGFEEVVKLELVRVVRGAQRPLKALRLYEMDVRDYLKHLVDVMGVDYVSKIIPQLPSDVAQRIMNALNSLLQGGQSGSGSSGTP